MDNVISKINFNEVNYFYKNPLSLVDYSLMQSFSIIKSSIEIFAYYDIKKFTNNDIHCFFEKLQLLQKKNNRVFVPSLKKIDGVLKCCIMTSSNNILSYSDGFYFIENWDSRGYKYEIELAYKEKRIFKQ